MNILGYVQTNDRVIFDLVDILPDQYAEFHARSFDQKKYVRVIDRWLGASGSLHVDDIRLIFRIKNI